MTKQKQNVAFKNLIHLGIFREPREPLRTFSDRYFCIAVKTMASSNSESKVDAIRVIPIPMLDDNYSYLLIDENGVCAVVDPAEPKKALAAAEKHGVTIAVVLTTHKHWVYKRTFCIVRLNAFRVSCK